MAGQVVQAGARFAGGLGGLLTGQKPLVSPERAAEMGGAVTSAIDKPFGKSLGAVGQLVGSPDLAQGVQSPAYQNEASNRIMQAISQYGNQGAEVIAQKTGLPLEDVQNMMGTMSIPAGIGVGKVLGAAGRGISDVKAQLGQQFAERRVKPVQPTEAVAQPYQSGGAAAVAHENAVKAALAEAAPELRAELGNKQPQEFTPQELKALEIHNKFAQVDPDFVPTEGQALQDVAKLSDEYNTKAKPGNEALRAKFEQRDPMLIKGFNNIKEQFAPDHSGVKQEGKANNILEEVKTNNVDVDNRNIKNAYEALNNTNGEFVVDMQVAAKDALEKIAKSKRTNRIPKEMRDTLEAYASGEYTGNAIDFENLRTDTASDIRKAQKAGDGAQEHVLSTIRNSFEDLPMKGEEAIAFKEKADIARTLFKRQKDLLNPEKPTYNKLYAMAYEDNRTPAEILLGNVPHPGANKFFENFVTGSKTTPADLSRMLELVGKDSPAHQELIAGLVDHLKQKAGVIDDKGNVSQKALRKELNNIGSRLDLIAGPEIANRLRNIGDVAELSEHVRNQGGGSANVSQTAITSEREAAQKAIKEAAFGLGEAALNFKTGGVSGIVSPVFKSMFEAKKLKAAAEAEALAQQNKLQQITSRTAGINKQPTRIDLRNMAPGQPD
jgi:hypothetical protein